MGNRTRHKPASYIYKEVDYLFGPTKRKGWQLIRPISNTVACSGTNTDEGKTIYDIINSHKALLEATKDALSWARHEQEYDEKTVALVEILEKAIAQAEGK